MDSSKLVSQRTSSAYQQDFRQIGMLMSGRLSTSEWVELFTKLVYWDLELEKYLRNGHDKRYQPEGDVLKAQELISWSDHLVFVYPTWWAGLPALLRLLRSLFKYIQSPI